MSPTQHFLLIHHRGGNSTEVRPFGKDEQAAMDAYEAAELAHMDDEDYNVLLVGAESEEAMRVTHASYFRLGTDCLDIAEVRLGA